MNESEAWSFPSVVEFFEQERNTTSKVYRSEWFFLKDLLKEDIRILDIGCALGGFSQIVSENVKSFSYTGVDISPLMVERARQKYPEHRFLVVQEDDLSALGDEKFDLVLCLGILHLNKNWRGLLSEAWRMTSESLLIDLRETSRQTIEDIKVAYFKMDFNGSVSGQAILPYNILNASDALNSLETICAGRKSLSEFGYSYQLGDNPVSPIKEVMMKTYCVRR